MHKPHTIQSAHNPLLKEIRRAAAHGGLTRSGRCVAEGPHLLEEALRSGLAVESVLATEEMAPAVEALLGPPRRTRLLVLPPRLLAQISTTETTQGVLALVRPPEWGLEDLFRRCAPVVVLDRVQDPGNAGAIARAAEAFGAAGLLWIRGAVSRWNPKTLRSSAGSLFRLPVVDGVEPSAAAALLRERGAAIRIAVPRKGAAPWALDWRVPCALVIGNEAHGAGPEWIAAGEPVRIPTAGVESLNAAAAAAVLLYEAMRQRGAP